LVARPASIVAAQALLEGVPAERGRDARLAARALAAGCAGFAMPRLVDGASSCEVVGRIVGAWTRTAGSTAAVTAAEPQRAAFPSDGLRALTAGAQSQDPPGRADMGFDA
jgi:hypothetical protein